MNKLLLYLIAVIGIWIFVINPLNNNGNGGQHKSNSGAIHGGGGARR